MEVPNPFKRNKTDDKEEDKHHEEKEEEPQTEIKPYNIKEKQFMEENFQIFEQDEDYEDDDDDESPKPELQTEIRNAFINEHLIRKQRIMAGSSMSRNFRRQRRESESIREKTKFDTLYDDIQDEDTDKAKTAITLLNTELNMSNESMKNQIQPDRFVCILLSHLSSSDPSLMILASNWILTLIDLLPEISDTIIDENGLKILEDKGKAFEYIDVAEDCIKILDKIAVNCPLDVWKTGWVSHFLGFIDFFDKSVQGIIMDLVKKWSNEFYSLNQYNEEIKQWFTIVGNRWASLNLSDGDMLLKNLEWITLLLSRLNDWKYSKTSVDSDDDDIDLNTRSLRANQKLRNYLESRKNKNSDSSVNRIQEIYDELFWDHSCIVNFMKMLKECSVQTSQDKNNKKIQSFLFKILNLCCSSSNKICATVLKNGFIDIILTWMKVNHIDTAENEEADDLEEFKISSGGAATTSFHMARKNSNAKITDLTNSQESVNQREIMNLISTILSIKIDKQQDLTEAESECKMILTNKALQLQLGKLGSNFMTNFADLQSWGSLSACSDSAIMKKHKVLEIMSKIIALLDPEILAISLEPCTISKQLKLFLMNSWGYNANSMILGNLHRSGSLEEKYILTTLKVIHTLLVKSDKENTDFWVPMIREGVLDIIKEMQVLSKDDKKELPSMEYIKHQICNFKSVLDNSDNEEEKEKEVQENLTNYKTVKQQIKDMVLGIAVQLEEVNYDKEPMIELKRISKVLKNPESSINLCKEAMSRFSQLILKDGMTHYEVEKSEIITSLHTFLIDPNHASDYSELTLWKRIHIFIDEFLGSQKSICLFVEHLHNLVDIDEAIEDLHVNNSANGFIIRSRFAESEQVKIICKPLKSSLKVKEKPVIASFLNSMANYEQEGQDLQKKTEDEEQKEFIENASTFTIMVPSEYSMKNVVKIIKKHLGSSSRLDTSLKDKLNAIRLASRFNSNTFSTDHKFLESLKLLESSINAHQETNLIVEEEDSSDEDMDVPKIPSLKMNKVDKLNLALISIDEEEIDLNLKAGEWLKQTLKNHKPLKSYIKIFDKESVKIPNIVRFTIKDDVDEEMDDWEEEIKSIEGKTKTKIITKTDRTYSLYVQKEKHKKTLQDRELERLIAKDIKSNQTVHEELGDQSCRILELLKFIFLLKSSNFKSLFKAHSIECKNKPSKSLFPNELFMNPLKFKALFINSKIDSLIRKYLLQKHTSDWLSKRDGVLVELVQNFPMLYDFKTRTIFFKLTAFGNLRNKYFASELFTRALIRDEGGMSISRRRMETPRQNVLEDAFDKLNDLQSDSSFLEFQFENEVGTGLGPTLEYYALIGKAIKEEPNMWRETTDNTLYPNPLNMKTKSFQDKKNIERFFELVGTITARSLMDERLIDLPISVVFWKLVFSETAILEDVEQIDKPFYKGLKMVQDIIDSKNKNPLSTFPTKYNEMHMKEFREEFCPPDHPQNWDCPDIVQNENEINIEDLCLTFALPGTENINLVKNGNKKIVNEKSMNDYLRLILNWLFNDAVKLQVNAFRKGINNVFRMDALKWFLFEELEGLISGEDNQGRGIQKWNKKTLLENVIPDHGYDHQSPAFLNFIQYMEELNQEELRNFLMFITGSPRLPLGGLKSLRPKLTVVKRTWDEGINPDSFLPSVMTCQNYVKLPEYSTLEILKEKMNYAIREGVNSFNLS